MRFVKQQHVFPSSTGLPLHVIPLTGFLKICVTSRTLEWAVCIGVGTSGYPSLVCLSSRSLLSDLPKGKSVFLKQFPSLTQFRVQLRKWLYKANRRSDRMGQGGGSKRKDEVPIEEERGRE